MRWAQTANFGRWGVDNPMMPNTFGAQLYDLGGMALVYFSIPFLEEIHIRPPTTTTTTTHTHLCLVYVGSNNRSLRYSFSLPPSPPPPCGITPLKIRGLRPARATNVYSTPPRVVLAHVHRR
jgi:hypothetical protein